MRKICKNIGLIDAFIRIMLGCLLLVCHKNKQHPILAVLGSMKVAEGITRFCPCLYLMKKDTCEC